MNKELDNIMEEVLRKISRTRDEINEGLEQGIAPDPRVLGRLRIFQVVKEIVYGFRYGENAVQKEDED